MLERQLYDYYRLDSDNIMYINDDIVVSAKGKLYLIRPSRSMINKKKFAEQLRMLEHLTVRGEFHLLIPVKAEGGNYVSLIDGQESVLFEIVNDFSATPSVDTSIGRKLAQFHIRGEDYEPSFSSWQGVAWLAWQNRWIKRLEQLEGWFVKKQTDVHKTPADELFLLSFPYFLGMSENAIQMLTDMQLSHAFIIREGKGHTICHQRFEENTWLTLDSHHISLYKVPTDFIYDHLTRDIAEYIRYIATTSAPLFEKKKRIHLFLTRYSHVRVLETVDKTLLLARLCFPIHYYDAIEAFYQTIDSRKLNYLEEDMYRIINEADDYEAILNSVAAYCFPEGRSSEIMPEWLLKKSSYASDHL
ncbi:spore coat protein YutH [Salipaludibacillus agaradhaerens]|uniref:spore coat putative kinase YutH n=1 Tax=Salipaludibacillus agaradhaerens TaxID=76935 RepID=UPI002151CE09|nr:spore coat protein YutH [Salipaludibacillus agaradhaerens]MCR6107836.1 spore coat protein YutH [Salipaludibacillus agaradhaerens]MCR6119865.1 spore coat protein YutH [Salipaludibacillus agaradhaerens]